MNSDETPVELTAHGMIPHQENEKPTPRPEMPVELTYEEAVALLPEGGEIHTYLDGGGFGVIGADWEREKILTLLRESPSRQVTGPMAQSMGHGLAAYDNGIPVFIETKASSE